MSTVVFLMGATATGKTAVSLECAKKLGGEIIGCDSIQIYSPLIVGSARPSQEEMKEIPHHLVGTVSPPEVMTAGEYRRQALKIIEARKHIPFLFVTGGTGFYFRALEKGVFPMPVIPDEIRQQIKGWLNEKGLADLYARLQKKDPEEAARLAPQDAYRIQRALEVELATGKKMSVFRKEFEPIPFPYHLIKIGLEYPKELLYKRILNRTRRMLDNGWLEEVQRILDQGWGAWPPLKSVGYRECIQYLHGEISRKELETTIVLHTRQLAKRQRTWFKADSTIKWFQGNQKDEIINWILANNV